MNAHRGVFKKGGVEKRWRALPITHNFTGYLAFVCKCCTGGLLSAACRKSNARSAQKTRLEAAGEQTALYNLWVKIREGAGPPALWQ